jgi:hypothetical protein
MRGHCDNGEVLAIELEGDVEHFGRWIGMIGMIAQ